MHVVLNGAPVELEEGATLGQLLEKSAVPAGKVAVAVNKAVVARSRIALTVLREGDRVEVIEVVGGG